MMLDFIHLFFVHPTTGMSTFGHVGPLL